MRNPFSYGSLVAGDQFCNRLQEMAELRKAVDDGLHLFLYGERRTGKTSLLYRLRDSLPPEDYIIIFVDVWTVDSEEMFAKRCAAAYLTAFERKPETLLRTAKEWISGLAPELTVGPDGMPALTFRSVARGTDAGPLLTEILHIPRRIAERHPEKQILVVFDEFQRIREFDTGQIERTLRSAVQEQGDIAYIFCGSRKHLIREMFLNEESPLFRSAAHFPIGNIGSEHWEPYIVERFRRTGKKISSELIRRLVSLSEGHPFYTQMLAHAVWGIVDDTVKPSDIDEAVSILLDREQYAYGEMWNALPLSARNMMRAIVTEAPLTTPYTAEIGKRYELKSPSTAQRAIKYLVTNDIVENTENGYIVIDRFFRLWVERRVML